MITLALAAFVIGGSVCLPTGSEFFSIFPVAFGGIGGGNTSLFAFLLPVLFAYRCVSTSSLEAPALKFPCHWGLFSFQELSSSCDGDFGVDDVLTMMLLLIA